MGGCVMFRSDPPGESFGEGSYGITLVIANRVGDACNCAGVYHQSLIMLMDIPSPPMNSADTGRGSSASSV
jgi:hypothetical protein